MAQRPVTLTDNFSRHVSLEIEGFDRFYFNGWVPVLTMTGQVAGWLRWRGFLIASPPALGQDAQAFWAAVRRCADGNQIPWMVLATSLFGDPAAGFCEDASARFRTIPLSSGCSGSCRSSWWRPLYLATCRHEQPPGDR
jgi:hypothetical protein